MLFPHYPPGLLNDCLQVPASTSSPQEDSHSHAHHALPLLRCLTFHVFSFLNFLFILFSHTHTPKCEAFMNIFVCCLVLYPQHLEWYLDDSRCSIKTRGMNLLQHHLLCEVSPDFTEGPGPGVPSLFSAWCLCVSGHRATFISDSSA